ncbi:MAG: hypothetical protein IE931_06985 [Sphingobacteriales bacterium]|nr:hypothetical protein [Sphingobacteriales bacterium]
MKTKKNLISTIAILFITFTGAFAQKMDLETLKKMNVDERATYQTELMKSKLYLSQEQLEKISELNVRYSQKMQTIINSSDNKFSKAKAMKNIQDEKEIKLKEILTAEQYREYEKEKKEMIEKAKDQYRENN